MADDLKAKMIEKMEKAIQHLKTELATIRTGRASLALFDSVKVNFYGTLTPLQQMSSLSIPDSRTVIIQPWDISLLQEIEKALTSSSLGLSASNDGKLIRITIPPLTEERRKELVKLVKRMGEESRISIRNIRREANEGFKTTQKEDHISEDMVHTEQANVQKLTDQQISVIEGVLQKKEAEVLAI
ncbi:MAG: ribosome recycling factor [Nitrospirae bacterium]|nr:ribosome recycling factor [Candidatus Manganitrophaceae bacterium]